VITDPNLEATIASLDTAQAAIDENTRGKQDGEKAQRASFSSLELKCASLESQNRSLVEERDSLKSRLREDSEAYGLEAANVEAASLLTAHDQHLLTDEVVRSLTMVEAELRRVLEENEACVRSRGGVHFDALYARLIDSKAAESNTKAALSDLQERYEAAKLAQHRLTQAAYGKDSALRANEASSRTVWHLQAQLTELRASSRQREVWDTTGRQKVQEGEGSPNAMRETRCLEDRVASLEKQLRDQDAQHRRVIRQLSGSAAPTN